MESNVSGHVEVVLFGCLDLNPTLSSSSSHFQPPVFVELFYNGDSYGDRLYGALAGPQTISRLLYSQQGSVGVPVGP